MDAGFSGGVTDHADRLARALTGAGIGLRSLAADRQPTQVTDPAIAFNALQTFQIHADFPAQISFDHVLAILNGMNDLRELLLGQVLGAQAGIDIGAGENLFGVGRADAINITQRDFDAFVGWNFYSDDASHISLIS